MYFRLDLLRVEVLETLLCRAIDEVSSDILRCVNKPYLTPYDEKKLERLEDRQHLLVSMYHDIKLFK